MARIRSVSSHVERPLAGSWECTFAIPGGPPEKDWIAAAVPGTAASALRTLGRWEPTTQRDFDAEDVYYRCRFPGPVSDGESASQLLRFGGLATLAEVFLNGHSILRSDSMYRSHALEVGERLAPNNELIIRFSGLAAALKEKRPRPRFRTNLVANQNLRYFRTTFLGRMPGWCPSAAPVGPFRAVTLTERRVLSVERADVRPRVEGSDGVVDVALELRGLQPAAPAAATLLVGSERGALQVTASAQPETFTLHGTLRIPAVALWWPHTHGAQPLYPVRVVVALAGAEVMIDLGQLGFRTVTIDDEGDGGFGLVVNGARVFCRGACHTPLDPISLAPPLAALSERIALARAAHMNMLRVPGILSYEPPEFFELCDQAGVMVFQDFMFANLDYPTGNAGFEASVRTEVAELLDATQVSPSLCVLCGNSEGEQQAAMAGAPREAWESPLFHAVIPEGCQALRPDVPYWPSSAHGGPLPFAPSTGTTSYYGVGAYLRPLDDARRSGLRFATECLAFANLPEPATLEAAFPDKAAIPHHPLWKTFVPRDPGAGWDFEDVRDHYLAELFAVTPMRLRATDLDGYLQKSRVVTGEVMAAAFGEWRRPGSRCRGALVFQLGDVYTGAGWGVIDGLGTPKAAYYYLRRAFAPVAIFVTDEGQNGLVLHAVNDTDTELAATLRLQLYLHGDSAAATGEAAIRVPARGGLSVPASALFDRFVDTAYAYRFGPPTHRVAGAALVLEGSATPVSEAFHFPLGLALPTEADPGLTASCERGADGVPVVVVRSRGFAQSVVVSARGYLPEDSYFHLLPGGEKRVRLLARGDACAPLRGSVQALNTHAIPVRFSA